MTPSQYAAQKFGAFIHFNLNTWTGNGSTNCSPSKDPAMFAPTSLSVSQWANVYLLAQMSYAVLVARHGQGFCIWDTATTTYKSSTDIVSQFMTTFRARGLSPCLYFSTADLRFEFEQSGSFTQAQYLSRNKAQLTELLTNYGAISAIWVDPNNWGFSGDGFIGISRPSTYYPWAAAGDLRTFVQGIQSNCVVVYDDHLTTFTSSDVIEYEPPLVDGTTQIPNGNTDPAEQCGPIAANGDYFHDINYTPVSAATILSSIRAANANGGTFLLNAPPNQTGQIDDSLISVLGVVGQSLTIRGAFDLTVGVGVHQPPHIKIAHAVRGY